MKEQTKIRHQNKDLNCCTETLQKQQWGTDGGGSPFWRMTCWKCGFSEIVTDTLFCKWQYCDEVVL